MTRFTNQKIVEEIVRVGLVPVFYNNDLATSKKIVTACVAGGASVVEFTNRGEGAPAIFQELINWGCKELPDIIIGAGTILNVDAAERFLDIGAHFLVGPIFNPQVATLCTHRKVAYIPGCLTPTEIITAETAGAEVIKVFPGSTVGPEFIKALLGPCPWLKLMPSGGVEVNQQNIAGWIQAGASALNIGSNLIRRNLVNAGDFTSIQAMVADCIRWIKEAREKTATSSS